MPPGLGHFASPTQDWQFLQIYISEMGLPVPFFKMARPITLSMLMERIETSIESGRIEVTSWADVDAAGEIRLTNGELILLLAILFPDHYERNLEVAVPSPTSAPPGTKRKILEMQKRVARGESPYSPADADMSRAKGKWTTNFHPTVLAISEQD